LQDIGFAFAAGLKFPGQLREICIKKAPSALHAGGVWCRQCPGGDLAPLFTFRQASHLADRVPSGDGWGVAETANARPGGFVGPSGALRVEQQHTARTFKASVARVRHFLDVGSVAIGADRALASGECLYLAALIESAGEPRLMRLVAS